MAKDQYPLGDYLKSINETKEDLTLRDPEWMKKYPPFIINRCLSSHMDAIMMANEMNFHHQLDNDLFRRLNKRNLIPKINNITNAKALNKGLKDWYGDYRNYYVNDRDGNIYFPVNNFKIVLRRSTDGYVFKEIKKDILKKGSIGFRVKEVEKFFGIKQDGYFDEELVNLVKAFQKKNNLKPDGIIGDNTLKHMEK